MADLLGQERLCEHSPQNWQVVYVSRFEPDQSLEALELRCHICHADRWFPLLGSKTFQQQLANNLKAVWGES